MGTNSRREVSYGILKLVMRYIEIENSVHNYGTNVQIYNSEIHLISQIAKNPGIHIRGLAKKLGIAGASVSETARKLENKGLIRKEVSPDNQSRLCLYLTTKGMLAHEEHEKYHRILERMTEEQLAEVPDEQVEFITKFLGDLLKRMEDFERLIE